MPVSRPGESAGPNDDALPVLDTTPGRPAVRGLLHRPDEPERGILVLTHGAGSDCRAPLLRAVARAVAARGVAVLRCDLPFRQARLAGPPALPGAALDREGLRRAVEVARGLTSRRVFLGGHSYGGRQASLLVADDPGPVEALLLLAYPLHPPRRPGDLRTAHFARLGTPALFVHGSRDPFGTVAELRTAIRLIPAPTRLLAIDGAGHDLGGARAPARLDRAAADAAGAFVGLAGL